LLQYIIKDEANDIAVFFDYGTRTFTTPFSDWSRLSTCSRASRKLFDQFEHHPDVHNGITDEKLCQSSWKPLLNQRKTVIVRYVA